MFNVDPEFSHCFEAKQPNMDKIQSPKVAAQSNKLDTCRVAWALRIIDSKHIYLYGGGFYSFFNDYKDLCGKKGDACQQRLIDTSYSEEVWIYSLYTVGAREVVSPQGNR